MTYQDLVVSLAENPRNICTAPTTNKEPKWFFAYSENGKVYIESGRTNKENSKIVGRRMLIPNKFEQMSDIYHRRELGEHVSKEATKATVNQVYWFGIFKEMCL